MENKRLEGIISNLFWRVKSSARNILIGIPLATTIAAISPNYTIAQNQNMQPVAGQGASLEACLPEPDYLRLRDGTPMDYNLLKNGGTLTGGRNIAAVDIYQSTYPIPIVSPIEGIAVFSNNDQISGNVIIIDDVIVSFVGAHFAERLIPDMNALVRTEKNPGNVVYLSTNIAKQGRSGANAIHVHTNASFFGNAWFFDDKEMRFESLQSFQNYLLNSDKHANGKPFMLNYWEGKPNIAYNNLKARIVSEIDSLRDDYGNKKFEEIMNSNKGPKDSRLVGEYIKLGKTLSLHKGFMRPMQINDIAHFWEVYQKKFSSQKELNDDPLAARIMGLKALVEEAGRNLILYSIFPNHKDPYMITLYMGANPKQRNSFMQTYGKCLQLAN